MFFLFPKISLNRTSTDLRNAMDNTSSSNIKSKLCQTNYYKVLSSSNKFIQRNKKGFYEKKEKIPYFFVERRRKRYPTFLLKDNDLKKQKEK